MRPILGGVIASLVVAASATCAPSTGGGVALTGP
jgi:hypothetical protein